MRERESEREREREVAKEMMREGETGIVTVHGRERKKYKEREVGERENCNNVCFSRVNIVSVITGLIK